MHAHVVEWTRNSQIPSNPCQWCGSQFKTSNKAHRNACPMLWLRAQLLTKHSSPIFSGQKSLHAYCGTGRFGQGHIRSFMAPILAPTTAPSEASAAATCRLTTRQEGLGGEGRSCHGPFQVVSRAGQGLPAEAKEEARASQELALNSVVKALDSYGAVGGGYHPLFAMGSYNRETSEIRTGSAESAGGQGHHRPAAEAHHPSQRDWAVPPASEIPWQLQIQNRTQEAQAACQLITRFVRSGVTRLVACALRPSKLGRSPLAVAVDRMINDLRVSVQQHGLHLQLRNPNQYCYANSLLLAILCMSSLLQEGLRVGVKQSDTQGQARRKVTEPMNLRLRTPGIYDSLKR